MIHRKKFEAFFRIVLVADAFMLPPKCILCHFDTTLRFQTVEADDDSLKYVYTKRLAASNAIPQNALTAQAAIQIPCDLWKVA